MSDNVGLKFANSLKNSVLFALILVEALQSRPTNGLFSSFYPLLPACYENKPWLIVFVGSEWRTSSFLLKDSTWLFSSQMMSGVFPTSSMTLLSRWCSLKAGDNSESFPPRRFHKSPVRDALTCTPCCPALLASPHLHMDKRKHERLDFHRMIVRPKYKVLFHFLFISREFKVWRWSNDGKLQLNSCSTETVLLIPKRFKNTIFWDFGSPERHNKDLK